MVKTLYLAHCFYHRKMIRKWELRMEAKYDINLDNPFYDNPARQEEVELLDSVKDKSREQAELFAHRTRYTNKSIVEDDLEKIRKSDGIVAIVNDTQIGTPMEIFYAARILRIPVYIITRKYFSHPWIKEHAAMIFKNRANFEAFVKAKFKLKGYENGKRKYYGRR